MKKANTVLVIVNTLTFLAMLFANYASNVHIFADVNVAEVSKKYDTLFAPANYAFLIWPVIYLLCFGFVIYEWVLLKNDPKQYIKRTGIWFTVSNLTNALWCYYWVHEWFGTCVLLILIQLFSLLVLVVHLRLELDDEPVRTIFFVWWPIAFYVGWMLTATIACIAAWLVSIQWNGFGLSDDTWTIIMIIAALLFYLLLHIKRNMRESSTVGVWALIAITVRQWDIHKNIAFTAIGAAVILTIFISIHFYKGRNYIPFVKLKRGEW